MKVYHSFFCLKCSAIQQSLYPQACRELGWGVSCSCRLSAKKLTFFILTLGGGKNIFPGELVYKNQYSNEFLSLSLSQLLRTKIAG
jgi:hypothetical protein